MPCVVDSDHNSSVSALRAEVSAIVDVAEGPRDALRPLKCCQLAARVHEKVAFEKFENRRMTLWVTQMENDAI